MKVLVCLFLLIALALVCTEVQAQNGPAFSWAGTYQVTSTCGEDCCCLTGTLNVEATSDSSAVIKGQVTCSTIPVTIPINGIQSATLIETNVNGEDMKLERSGVKVTMSNVDSPDCSGAATCTSGNCFKNSSSTTKMSITLLIVSMIAYMLLF